MDRREEWLAKDGYSEPSEKITMNSLYPNILATTDPVLKYQHMKLTTVDVEAIAEAVIRNGAINEIDLSKINPHFIGSNKLTESAGVSLAAALYFNSGIIRLDLCIGYYQQISLGKFHWRSRYNRAI